MHVGIACLLLYDGGELSPIGLYACILFLLVLNSTRGLYMPIIRFKLLSVDLALLLHMRVQRALITGLRPPKKARGPARASQPVRAAPGCYIGPGGTCTPMMGKYPHYPHAG